VLGLQLRHGSGRWNGAPYKELTVAYFDRRDPAKLAKRLVRRLEDLGLQITVQPAA